MYVAGPEKADEADEDEIYGNDVVQQPGNCKDEYPGDQRYEGGKTQGAMHDGSFSGVMPLGDRDYDPMAGMKKDAIKAYSPPPGSFPYRGSGFGNSDAANHQRSGHDENHSQWMKLETGDGEFAQPQGVPHRAG